MENKLRSDLWKAIQAHFERNDYTEAVRDTFFFLCEIIREKSGLSDKDGTTLIEHAFLGKTPIVLINKNETTTEKNAQQGVGLALKGMMQAIRDPISHEKTVLKCEEAEAIILFSNYLLNQIDKSKAFSKIGDITELLYDDDFTSTEEYAKCLIKEVPSKKRYDLLISLFLDRKNLPQNNLRFFIDELVSCQTKASYDDYLRIVSNSLIKCKNDMELRMYFHYFMNSTYERIDKLAQLRIEALIEKSLLDGKMEDYYENSKLVSTKINKEGTLSTWVRGRLRMFSSYETMLNVLFRKISFGGNESEFVYTYFSLDLIRDNLDFKHNEIKVIKEELLKGNADMYYLITSNAQRSQECEKRINALFVNEITECKKLLDVDIPF